PSGRDDEPMHLHIRTAQEGLQPGGDPDRAVVHRPILLRHATDPCRPRQRSFQPCREKRPSWLMLVMPFGRVGMARTVPSAENLIDRGKPFAGGGLGGAGSFRPDLHLHWSVFRQINLFRGTKHTLL